MAPGPREFSKYARSMGLISDRCLQKEQAFGSAWLIADDQVVTCAHQIVPYVDFLPALKIKFPSVNQEWEVSEAYFHPQFDRDAANEFIEKSKVHSPVANQALADHNVVLLKLKRGLTELDPERRTAFNRIVAVAPQAKVKGLAGPLDELGLALVIQTITNARKDGCLVISDERNRPVAKLFCRDGKIIFAKYGNLENEAAVYQLFAQQISGQFHFVPQSKPDWTVYAVIERNTDSLLLEAYRRLDELPNLLRDLGGAGVVYVRAADILDSGLLSTETQGSAEKIWNYLDGGVAVDLLFEITGLDDYSIYKAIEELYRTRQIVELPFTGQEELGSLTSLPLAPHMLLSPWDEVVSLSCHGITGRAQVRRGNLVGLIRPNDPWHLLHSLSLPSRLSGSPFLKDGEVIGMHCGTLPLDPKLYALPNLLSQMIWVESIHQMVYGTAKSAAGLRPGKKSKGMRTPLAEASSANDKIQCPKCAAAMVKQAKFCGTCGHRLQA